jgi:hypothetical protein
MFSLLLSIAAKVCSINFEPSSVPLWTEEELESFVTLWLVIFSTWIKTAMFLLYHSKGCNICKLVLHECYVNDLYTTTCSGMLGHHICQAQIWTANGSSRTPRSVCVGPLAKLFVSSYSNRQQGMAMIRLRRTAGDALSPMLGVLWSNLAEKVDQNFK